MKPLSQSFLASRRGFLRRAALGGLTAITVTLLGRRNSQACVSMGICPGCPAYDDCTLPRSLARKKAAALRAARTP